MNTNNLDIITPAKVIVFENNEYLMKSMVSYLVIDGYEVTGVSSVDEFHKQSARHSFSVAILAVDQPDHSGLLLAEFVHKNSTLRIITLSDDTLAINRKACLKAGADIYLIKPVNFRLLSASVGILIRRSYSLPWAPVLIASEKKLS